MVDDLGLKDPRFRHELKYEMPIATANEFFRDIEPFCALDKHSGETGSYEIASTYYDSADLQFYVDREESVGYRRKIRLRSYNKGGQSVALFVEIKEKHRSFVSKKRINLRNSDILQAGIPHNKLPLEMVIEQLEDTAEAREIAYLHNRFKLYPVAIIRYHRKALIPHFEQDIRITLDTDITTGGESLNQFDPKHERHILRADFGVLEVKTNDTIPLWLSSALNRFGMSQVRYSKYCLGVDRLYARGHQRWIPSRDFLSQETDQTVYTQAFENQKKVAGMAG